MDPQNQQETGKFGDTTKAVSDTESAGVPVDNTDETVDDSTDEGTETKDAVEVDDNASEAASVETVNTEQTISRTTEERATTPSQSGNAGGVTPPSTPTTPTPANS